MADEQNIIGLNIGGPVGPTDRVGMHIDMPEQPGVGVRVNINKSIIDNNIKEIVSKIPATEPNAEQIKKVANESLATIEPSLKLEKIKELLVLTKDIAAIAAYALEIKRMLGI